MIKTIVICKHINADDERGCSCGGGGIPPIDSN